MCAAGLPTGNELRLPTALGLQIRGRGKEGGLRVWPGLLEWAQGALPGHVVALSTLLASESVKLGGRELKVKRPRALSSLGRFLMRDS